MEKQPSVGHEERFLLKLLSRDKKYISLAPYFIKLWIVVFIIYLCSVLIWYDIKSLEQGTVLELIHKLR